MRERDGCVANHTKQNKTMSTGNSWKIFKNNSNEMESFSFFRQVPINTRITRTSKSELQILPEQKPFERISLYFITYLDDISSNAFEVHPKIH